MTSDRYYILRAEGVRWWNFPYKAFKGADYPWGRRLGIACTQRGAMRLIRRDKKLDARTPDLLGVRPVYIESSSSGSGSAP